MTISKSNKPVLHIITPVYNEGGNFPALYNQIKSNIKTPNELIVVYDFDQDTTVPIAKQFAEKDPSIKLVKNSFGPGPGNAIKSGFKYVEKGPCLVIMSDLSDDLSIADKMYEHYLEGSRVVCGSRYAKGGKEIGGPWFKRTLSRWVGNSLYYIRGFPTHDATNNFRLYDKKLLEQITIESWGGFEIAMEITVKAFKLGAKITEIPTTWRARTSGKSNFKLLKWLPSYLRWYFYALF